MFMNVHGWSLYLLFPEFLRNRNGIEVIKTFLVVESSLRRVDFLVRFTHAEYRGCLTLLKKSDEMTVDISG